MSPQNELQLVQAENIINFDLEAASISQKLILITALGRGNFAFVYTAEISPPNELQLIQHEHITLNYNGIAFINIFQ